MVNNCEETGNGALPEATLAFRWVYILLPALILLISVISVAWFYHLLPEELGYRFQSDGSADRFASRSTIVLWALLPQFLFALVAGGITWGITRLGKMPGRVEGAAVRPESILLVMGNMVALVQIILCFAMLDIFSYNSYQIHLLPLWVFVLIVMGGGGIILGIFFIRALLRVWAASKE